MGSDPLQWIADAELAYVAAIGALAHDAAETGSALGHKAIELSRWARARAFSSVWDRLDDLNWYGDLLDDELDTFLDQRDRYRELEKTAPTRDAIMVSTLELATEILAAVPEYTPPPPASADQIRVGPLRHAVWRFDARSQPRRLSPA